MAAIAALAMGGGLTAWAADACPTSPNYAAGFSSRPDCVAVNQNAAVGTVLQLTADSGSQYGSGWYTVPQVVQNGFSTTFQFKFTATSTPADGIAFVIQNAGTGTGAIGSAPNGGAIAYGDSDGNLDPSSGAGIPHSLAIEFDTYFNAGWDPAANPTDPSGSVSHVAVQSCGTGANTSHHNQKCSLLTSAPSSTLGPAVLVPALASTGSPTGTHTVVITYNPASGSTAANIHVMLDGHDLYPSGVAVDLSSIGLGDGGTAYVGFTGATGAAHETQAIQNWTFTPQIQVVTSAAPAVFNSQGGFDNNPDGGFDYNAQLNAGSNPVAVQVNQILMDQSVCTGIVQRTFPGAQCFAYRKADGTNPKSVMFEITCPVAGTCGTTGNPNFNALLGTDFHFDPADNNLFHNPLDPNSKPASLPRLAQGRFGYSGPTMPRERPQRTLVLEQSDQLLPGPPRRPLRLRPRAAAEARVRAGPQPTTSRTRLSRGFRSTFRVTDRSWPRGWTVAADFTCMNPTSTQSPSSATGPYLTSVPGACVGTVADGSNIDTATADTSSSTHSFTVKALDTGSNPNTQTVHYTVVAATDLAILNLGSLKVTNGGKVTYSIGVGDLGPVNAVNITVNDTLPASLSGATASGKTVSCSFVNKKLVCTTTPAVCTVNGNSVSCSVGPFAPLSLSSRQRSNGTNHGDSERGSRHGDQEHGHRDRNELRSEAGQQLLNRQHISDGALRTSTAGIKKGRRKSGALFILPINFASSSSPPASRAWMPRR